MRTFTPPLYQPNKSLLSDPSIKDEHLGQVLRQIPFTADVEEIFKRASIIAAEQELQNEVR